MYVFREAVSFLAPQNGICSEIRFESSEKRRVDLAGAMS
jgi:hypothetical protein